MSNNVKMFGSRKTKGPNRLAKIHMSEGGEP